MGSKFPRLHIRNVTGSRIKTGWENSPRKFMWRIRRIEWFTSCWTGRRFVLGLQIFSIRLQIFSTVGAWQGGGEGKIVIASIFCWNFWNNWRGFDAGCNWVLVSAILISLQVWSRWTIAITEQVSISSCSCFATSITFVFYVICGQRFSDYISWIQNSEDKNSWFRYCTKTVYPLFSLLHSNFPVYV